MPELADAATPRTMSSSGGLPPRAGALGYIAVDANPYRIRLLHAAIDGFILGTLEVRPGQLDRVVRFVRDQQDVWDATLVGIRHDRWPAGLLAALVQEFGPIHWIPRPMLSQTARQLREAHRFATFLRATYMVACAFGSSQCTGPLQLERWKRMMLFEFACSLEVSLDPLDDLPF